MKIIQDLNIYLVESVKDTESEKAPFRIKFFRRIRVRFIIAMFYGKFGWKFLLIN